ncbi:FAD dependent oxidoreductase [Niveomyces insectorum RCEF 264]|uniref:FAD dependent oxidoreductase n=1 Tax=Niveomyces insectorum RCEF 264 TaxID=1081102 RepID=A0A167NST8_9HYPO|nr:FAD dependent oxidoreductase [Niveomyces insectorum RCEF 264]
MTSLQDHPGQRSQDFPKSLIIVGAGVFGLSTALAVAKRYPQTSVTVVDRLTPPVTDGSSVDTTRCIRADYADPIYARLAKEAQKLIEADPGLQPYYFKQGMTFACDDEPSRFTQLWNAQHKLTKTLHPPDDIVEMPSREAVFRRIHGADAQPPPESALPEGQARWNVAYCNLDDAFIDAEACIRVYYERCRARPSIHFRCGVAVAQLLRDVEADGVCRGVQLEDGNVLHADKVVVAAGCWSNKLVYLQQRIHPIGHEVAWIKVTPEEEQRWAKMSITTNLSTGLNMFPPYRGEIKILRRSPGYINTVSVPHPEKPEETIEISYPRTVVGHPTDEIPLEAERALRANLKEIMPPLADRPFDRTKICWICTTPTADFLVAAHPRVQGVHLATGGSAHAWKFLPVIGDLVVGSMEGTLSAELVEKWAFEKSSSGKDQNAPRMDGDPEELREVVRSHL